LPRHAVILRRIHKTSQMLQARRDAKRLPVDRG